MDENGLRTICDMIIVCNINGYNQKIKKGKKLGGWWGNNKKEEFWEITSKGE